MQWLRTQLTLTKFLTGICSLLGIFGLGLLLHEWIGFLIDAYTHALNFAGYPTNGAFQLYNPLHRIIKGETPGVDFQVFHGLGVIFLHYPLFAFFGKTLYASEMARFIISPSLFIIIVSTFLYSTTRKWYVATLGTGLMVLIHYWHYLSTIEPLNSSLGVRAAMPIILACILIWFFSSSKTQWIFKHKFPWFELFSSILLAITLLMGTEHGFASLIAFGVVYVFFAPHKTFWKRILGSLSILGFYALAVFLIYFAIAGLHFLEPLKYAFVEVPADQFWYFGAPPNVYLTSLFNIFKNPFIAGNIITGVVFFMALVGIHYTKRFPYSFALLFLVAYGLLSNISLLGYYEPYYTEPLSRINILLLIWFGFTALPLFLKEYIPWIKKQSWLPALAFGQIFFIILGVVIFVRHYHEASYITPKLDLLTITDQQDKVKRSGTYLSDSWSRVQSIISEATGVGQMRISSFPLNDSNWKNGVGLRWNGFFMGASTSAEESLYVGQKLYFQQAGERTIERIDKNGLWWNVYVSGALLDPVADGYPNQIYIGQPKSAQPAPSIWSVYSGMLEADNDFLQPSGYDYIIHAVGPERRQEYVAEFDKVQPDYVISMRNDFFLYEEWLRNEHWDFYYRLVLNYKIVALTDYNLVWEKIDQPWMTQEDEGWSTVALLPGKSNLPLPLPAQAGHTDIQVYLVNVEYAIHNPIKFIPYIGNLPRYLIAPVNTASRTAVSLPPYSTSVTFPVIIYPGQDLPGLVFRTDSIIPGPDLAIKNVSYKILELDQSQIRLFVGAPLEQTQLDGILR